jgi:hypothetical protein
MGISPSGGQIYAAGANNTLSAYNLPSNDPAWIVKSGGDIQGIAVSTTEIYVGGHFGQIAGAKRQYLGSLSLDGVPTAWNPKVEGGTMGVWAVSLAPADLLAGGVFTKINGVSRKRFARFSGTP